ncbi:sugar phosphate isomerase/epimerase [Saccharopolyspora sp. HNM0983]|uniref:Sugar phosphate isomerase/epimerase n=1 Tax=Saccharopolyspora montiporae TaxID=2781240 RepID=A0A929FZF2_9PSEU|nr:TIM barrel protein [Saccharopolyspora sp. HNM0983]MBE9373672.1 sugar phosphate isomerase/epimerase [Saccharopolyspora sp. HNM0983]
MRPIGLAHLTLLRLNPPDLVDTAARAGYDFVGVRVKAVTEGEHQYPMQPGSPMSRETRKRLDDTGIEVRDVEFLALGPNTGPADWKPALDAGAALGARTISVVGTDPDRTRLGDTLAALTADAAPLGLVPTLEPISYQPVRTVPEAAELAATAGAAVLVDALHVQRAGGTPDDVRALAPELVPCLQLCDGPLDTPQHLDLPAELPLGMKADGSIRHVESRVQRRTVGEGQFPLADLVAAAPPGTPLSAEVPDAALQARLGPLDIAAHNLRAVHALLAEVDTDD